MRIKFKPILIVITSLLVLLIIASCGTAPEKQETKEKVTEDPQSQAEDNSTEEINYPDVDENPVVTITMENDEEIILELFPDIAPNSVANFISLIEANFYDGVIFHRVIPAFMIQGGDPEGTGSGGTDYSIPGEFSSNGFENDLVHERGVLSMARSNDPNSAGSQFFIMVADSPHLDGDYAGFGQVVEGMEVVDAIVATERDQSDKPNEPQRMKTVVVDTKGYDYPEPTKK